MRTDPGLPIDFFISYSPADERWATWIAWQLEAAGHTTLLQACLAEGQLSRTRPPWVGAA